MFKKILMKITGKKPVIETPASKTNTERFMREKAITESLMHAIKEQSKEDPLIGAKIGSKEVNQRLMDGMKSDRGVHIESMLCVLGSLAGYSCQANLRAQAVARGMPENAAFQVVGTKDGKKYFFGDPLNNALAESQYSVWGLAAGAAQHVGCNTLPDIKGIFKHTTEVLGSDDYGLPRVPDNHKSNDTPLNYLRTLWPSIHPTVKQFCPNPVDWPILFGLAIQEVIYMGKGIIDPGLALTIVMESAIPMSKVDLDSL